NAVDAVFSRPEAHRGLTIDPVATVHEAVRQAAPGLVELWPLVKPDEKPEIDPWDQPFDVRSETSPSVKLARQIAAAVKAWLAHGRDGALVVALRTRRPEVAKRFDELMVKAQELSPFAFYAELLGPGGGRRAFLARLGLEANDAIDEFLNLALDYESRETPSL